MNWTKIMKTITDDPKEFFETGGWTFLDPQSDSEVEGEGDESEEDDEYKVSDDNISDESSDDEEYDSEASDDESEDEDDDDGNVILVNVFGNDSIIFCHFICYRTWLR